MIMKLCIGESPFAQWIFLALLIGESWVRILVARSPQLTISNKISSKLLPNFFFFIYRIIAPNYELVEKGFKSSKALCKKKGVSSRVGSLKELLSHLKLLCRKS